MMDQKKWMAALALGLIVSGCSSSPDVEEDEMPVEGAEEASVATPEADEPGIDMTTPVIDEAGTLSDAYGDAQRWLPADTWYLTVAAGDPAWEEMTQLPFEAEGVEPGEPGTLEAIRDDVSYAMVEVLGFDPIYATESVSAVGEQGISLVIFGDYPEPTHLEAHDVGGGHVAYRVDVDALEFGDEMVEMEVDEDMPGFAEDSDELFVMRVDRPRPAMIMSDRLSILEDLQADEAHSLMSHGEALGALLDDGDHIGMAMIGSPVVEMFELDEEEAVWVPHHAYMGISEEGLSVDIEGDEEGLSGIQMGVSMAIDTLQAGAAEQYEARHDLEELTEEILMVHGYHFLTALAHHLEPEEEEGRLSYEMTYAGEPGWLAGLMSMGSVAYVGLSMVDWEDLAEEWLGDLMD